MLDECSSYNTYREIRIRNIVECYLQYRAHVHSSCGKHLDILSFMLVSPLRTTSNYVLFELALTDLGVGLNVHPLYILALYRVYKKNIPDCKIVTAYSISTTSE